MNYLLSGSFFFLTGWIDLCVRYVVLAKTQRVEKEMKEAGSGRHVL